MKFIRVAECYSKLEEISGRLEMIDILKRLFLEANPDEAEKIAYLTLGKIAPDYEGLELGLGEKLALRAISIASGVSEQTISKEYKRIGDIGKLAEWAVGKRPSLFGKEELTLDRVFSSLLKIARATGSDSQDIKIRTFAGLLSDSEPIEARYIARIVMGRLRLGVQDMTLLDALAEAYLGSRERRSLLEEKYNIYPDIGRIARAVAEKKEKGLEEIDVTLGVPIRPMLAQRVKSAEEVIERIPKMYAEHKYDGERMQIHIWKDGRVKLFSRRLEDITAPYPDVRDALKTFVGRDMILDSETVAVNPDTGEILPFQELMHRRRKYGVEEAMEQYPAVTYVFDILYLDGKSLINLPLRERRKILESIVPKEGNIREVIYREIDSNLQELEAFFEEAVEKGMEGLVIKDPNSRYQAGTRGWNWIKLKRSYISKMIEPVDLVAVGAFMGRGKRAGTYGALLMAVYDPKEDKYKTVCKMGSGFTDEDLGRLPEIFKPYITEVKDPSVESKIEADVWFQPKIVLEVIGDEITLSPVHTCGFNSIRKGSGLAIRFPRFTGRWRDDKEPEDATTEDEIIQMYKSQLKEIKEEEKIKEEAA
jgi:DNA ligase-1